MQLSCEQGRTGFGDSSFGTGKVGVGTARHRAIDQSDFRLVGEIVSRQLCRRAGMPNDRHLTQPRISRGQYRPGQPETLQRDRPRRRQQQIGARQKLVKLASSAFGFEVDDLDVLPGYEFSIPVRRRRRQRIANGRFYLDDIRAKSSIADAGLSREVPVRTV